MIYLESIKKSTGFMVLTASLNKLKNILYSYIDHL